MNELRVEGRVEWSGVTLSAMRAYLQNLENAKPMVEEISRRAKKRERKSVHHAAAGLIVQRYD